MQKIEFVSYDGSYPNLCAGTLVLKIDGEIVELPRHCLCSGGRVWFDENWREHVTNGKWSIGELPEEYEQYRSEITDLVNENVGHGCCGGCV